MYNGNYNFFDYKYNIIGYNGQDFGSIYQYIYLISSIILIIILLIIFRKLKKEQVFKITKYIGIFIIIIYIVKTIWESYYDIKLSGSFNTGLLPLDSCSFIMVACLLASSNNSKISELSKCWLTTGGIVGGLSNMLFLQSLNYYPFFTFGAFYSMIWHFLMVFIGLLIITTNSIELKYENVLKGFLFHLIISLVIIPIDFIFDFDFMMYHHLGGIPLFEGAASKLTQMNLGFLNPILMLVLYFFSFNLIYFLTVLINKIFNKKNV